jgi:hypothetical protein
VFNASAIDDVDGIVPVICTPKSGSLFPLGETKVECSASDSAGNTAHSSFAVTVADTTAPALSLPSSITTVATSSAGAVVTFTATALDVVDGARLVTCTPASGSTFAIGTMTVTCSAADTHSNTATGSFTVTVTRPTAAQLAKELAALAAQFGFTLNETLLGKVLEFASRPDTRNQMVACNSLNAMANQFKAQSDKKLTKAQADALIDLDNRLSLTIGCM